MDQYATFIPVAAVHQWAAEATQALLGFTIGLDEPAWHAPTRLPGWSRAHVATHLARGADYLRLVTESAAAGRPQPAPPERRQRFADLERGADRAGLQLQIDLDTSAGALQQALDAVTDWEPVIRLHGQTGPLSMVPLARLHEVYVHLLDLNPDFVADLVDAEAASWLLRWVVEVAGDLSLPAISLRGDAVQADLGSGGPGYRVSGSDARLWAWLSGREPAASVAGADGLQPPLLA